MTTRTVLLVNSDFDTRAIARQALEHHGYAVLEALDADAAIALIEDQAPVGRPVSLVITELYVRTSTGESLLTAAKRCTVPRPPLVLVLTTQTQPADRRAAAAADGFLAKPVTLVALLAEVRRLVPALSFMPTTADLRTLPR